MAWGTFCSIFDESQTCIGGDDIIFNILYHTFSMKWKQCHHLLYICAPVCVFLPVYQFLLHSDQSCQPYSVKNDRVCQGLIWYLPNSFGFLQLALFTSALQTLHQVQNQHIGRMHALSTCLLALYPLVYLQCGAAGPCVQNLHFSSHRLPHLTTNYHYLVSFPAAAVSTICEVSQTASSFRDMLVAVIGRC